MDICIIEFIYVSEWVKVNGLEDRAYIQQQVCTCTKKKKQPYREQSLERKKNKEIIHNFAALIWSYKGFVLS